MESSIKIRYPIFDVLRGLAIIGMIIFHFFYDLSGLDLISIDILQFPWLQFQYSIGFTFLFCVGASLRLAHFKVIRWNSFFRRLFFIAISAASVSLVTYIVMPDKWIYFGILHCITLATLIGIFFVRVPKISLVVGFLLLVFNYLFLYSTGENIPWVKNLPIIENKLTLDYYPFFPWFSYILIGIGSTVFPWYKVQFSIFKTNPFRNLFFLSKHSLLIYLLHQPVVYGILFLIKFYFIKP